MLTRFCRITSFRYNFFRDSQASLVALALILFALHGSTASAFGFDDVAARAASQEKAAYKPVTRKPPAELAALTYDQYRDIRFRPDHALWRTENLPFEMMFFHL